MADSAQFTKDVIYALRYYSVNYVIERLFITKRLVIKKADKCFVASVNSTHIWGTLLKVLLHLLNIE